jgi:peptidoglycan-associated lipoprotein
VPGSQEELTALYGDRVFFGTDQSDLQADARATLEGWSQWLRQYPSATLTVEGHCDERGTREYNLALGERRASAAKNYLVALGINPNRIATISYGKERPVVLGSNEFAWAQNRRGVGAVN